MNMKKQLLLLLFLVLLPMSLAKSGHMTLLAVSNEENPKGSTADLFLEVQEGTGRVFIDSFPLSKLDTQISTRFGRQIACNFIEKDCSKFDFFYTIRADSTIVGGPSASAAITVLTVSVLEDLPLDESTSITGTINSGGIIGPVGGIESKIQAGSESGMKKVLIPKFTSLNQSNISDYEDLYNIDVVEVSHLAEALTEMTGKNYSLNGEVTASREYLRTMESIGKELCNRAETLSEKVYGDEDNTSQLLIKGLKAINQSEYYSAASFCFGANINLRYEVLQSEKLSIDQIKQKIIETRSAVGDFQNHTDKKELNTITDLETYMVVKDRLHEADSRLEDALFELAQNNLNSSLKNLAIGTERLNSAQSWSNFFGKDGKKFHINKEVLEQSCLNKISEVEERIQYIEIYVSTGTEEARRTVKESYSDYNEGNPELCLYKASIAKAKIDLILNSMALDSEKVDQVIEDRLEIVGSYISKQNKRDIFPMLSYSYYEYANSLKESDQYSALLYLEYALELGTLDIYFEKKQIDLPNINWDIYLAYGSGLITGITVVLVVISFYRFSKKKKPN